MLQRTNPFQWKPLAKLYQPQALAWLERSVIRAEKCGAQQFGFCTLIKRPSIWGWYLASAVVDFINAETVLFDVWSDVR